MKQDILETVKNRFYTCGAYHTRLNQKVRITGRVLSEKEIIGND